MGFTVQKNLHFMCTHVIYFCYCWNLLFSKCDLWEYIFFVPLLPRKNTIICILLYRTYLTRIFCTRAHTLTHTQWQCPVYFQTVFSGSQIKTPFSRPLLIVIILRIFYSGRIFFVNIISVSVKYWFFPRPPSEQLQRRHRPKNAISEVFVFQFWTTTLQCPTWKLH